MKHARDRISAYIICYNEAERISQCLESIAWCDEIVVVDSGSNDNTLEICKSFTNKIFHRDWTGYGDQKNFALAQCSCDWVLNLDADEVVSEELKQQILTVLEDTAAVKDGYYLQRVVHFLNRWWNAGGWYPEYRLRLGRKSHFKWSNNPVHEKAYVKGSKGRLSGSLYHYTYRNIEDQLNRLNRYSSISAIQLYRKSLLFRRCPYLYIIVRPLARFCRFYLLKMGFIYGMAGFIAAVNDSYYTFLKYAKLWELYLNAASEAQQSSTKLAPDEAAGDFR